MGLSRMSSSGEEGGAGEVVGAVEEEDSAAAGVRGKEVEAAVETGEGEGSLEIKGRKSKLKVEAGDCREGDTEGGRQGLVELDLQLG